MGINLKFFKQLDWWIILSAVVLLVIGLMTIYSLSMNLPPAKFSNFNKQLIFIGLGFGVFFLFSALNYRSWCNYSGFFYLISIILLVLVLFLGKNIRGTSGWFVFGPFSLQPAELMKFFLVIALASYFHKRVKKRKVAWREVLISFLYTLIPVTLVSRQPDMGSAVVMLAVWAAVLYMAGLDYKKMFILVLLGIGGFLLSWNFFLQDYHKERVESFLNPELDPMGKGYNVIQSTVAVGSGGWSGKGLGAGSQSQLDFLPEKHNDFIFASIPEESGFLGTSLIFIFLGLLFWRLYKIITLCRDNFGKLLVSGILMFLFFHTFVNIGMNIGLMPVTGISLPFLSYGGSFLLITMASLGIAQSVYRRQNKERQLLEYNG